MATPGTTTSDPTAGFTVPSAGGALTPAETAQWQQYFASGSPQATTNSLVQTGNQFTANMPWLQQLGLPVQSLGLNFGGDTGANAQAAAASPYANNPYYSSILQAMGSGTNTPIYSSTQTSSVPANVTALAQFYGVPVDQLQGALSQTGADYSAMTNTGNDPWGLGAGNFRFAF